MSFVLQGPPGTGKSQTITNIIAECLANGKKVLFVSEKAAALEVVYKRLANAGLKDFCLTLHSHKSNKKEILEQLRVSLNLSQNNIKIKDEALLKLDLLKGNRDRLNDYCIAIHTKILPLDKTIYEVTGELASLQGCDNIIFSINNIRQTTVQRFNEYFINLKKYTDTLGKLSTDYKKIHGMVQT
jgi:RecA/RadA recombinase